MAIVKFNKLIMRDIKFRGKSNESGEWIYGLFLQDKSGKCAIFDENNRFSSGESILPDTLGQFTGVKDKNGVEIYEGDVIDHELFGLNQVKYGDFIFDNGYGGSETIIGFYFECERGFQYHLDYSYNEVMGNIYENADLLKI